MSNLPKKIITDRQGNEVLPITHVSAVYDDSGTPVSTLIANVAEEASKSYVPTLDAAPGPSTTTYTRDGATKDFVLGQLARVANAAGGYDFYQLTDLTLENSIPVATWRESEGGRGASYVPTLLSAPTSSTLTYTKDGKTKSFEMGQLCRVADNTADSGYTFYMLKNLVTENETTTASWENVGLDNVAYIASGTTASIPSFDPYTQSVHITAQTLSSAQQAQARQNIGAAAAEDAGGSYTPTLLTAPTSSTTTYTKDGKTKDFEIGQFCRVADANAETGYRFFQLHDLVTENNTTTAVWDETSESKERLTLQITSNNPSVVDIARQNAVITVKDNNNNTVWSGTIATTHTLILLPGVEYTISGSIVTGFSAQPVTHISQYGGIYTVNIEYDTTVVTVNLTADQGTPDFSEATITVTDTTTSETVSAQQDGTYLIALGHNYSVASNDITGFQAPSIYTEIANAASQTVTYTYLYRGLGVWAYYSDGTIKSYGNADSNAIGVAVITSNCSFVIDKVAYTSLRFGGYGITWDTDGIGRAADQTTAKLDYSGESNTTKIITALSGKIDGSSITGAPAAEWCRAQFSGVGYLPSLGELKTAYDNKSSVNSMMTKIGGTAINTSYHWASTLCSSPADSAWMLTWESGNIASTGRNGYSDVRAFRAL